MAYALYLKTTACLPGEGQVIVEKTLCNEAQKAEM